MHRLLLAIGVSSLLSLGALLRAEEGPSRLPLAEKDIPAPRVTWYGLYLNGTKCGYMREEFARSGEGADAAWLFDQTGTCRLESMGKELAIGLAERQEFDAVSPFAFRGGWFRKTQEGGDGQEVVITRDATGLSAKVTAGGETRTLPVPSIEYTLADQLTPERWIQAGPALGDEILVRTIDVSDLEADEVRFTVSARKEPIVEGVPTPFYEVRRVLASTGEEGVARFDAQGQLLSIVLGGLFEARVEPEEVAKRIEAATDLFVFGQAPIDKPIGAPRRVRRLVLKVDGEGAGSLHEGPSQTIARDAGSGEVTITLGVGAEETASAEEVEEALRETVDYPCSTPQVKALAAEAIGEAATPRDKVARLVHFVSEYLEDESVPGFVSVPQLLASRRGDCSEHAVLFATLARAAGIPAREVGGLMYMGDDVKAFGGHAWNEVAIDGRWVPVDATWDETEIDATHVTLDRKGKVETSLGVFGRLRFRLVSMEGEGCECPLCGQQATFDDTPEGAFQRLRMALLRRDEALLRECAILPPGVTPEKALGSAKGLWRTFMSQVTKTKVEGDRATLTVMNVRSEPDSIPCVRQDGVWKIDLTAGTVVAKGSAERDCLNNLRLIGTFMVMWCVKYGDDRTYPGPGMKLVTDLFAHPKAATAICRGNEGLLLCKASTEKNTPESVRRGDPDCTSYGITETPLSDATTSPDTPIMWDKSPVHDGKRNVLYFSGAAEALTEEEFQALMKKFQK